jgi:hypothetical protein
MAIPVIVMIISGLLWFLWDVVLPDNPRNPIPRFGPWFVQVLRIVFAASVLVVLWANMAERVVK